jgi:hypothetical protein
MRQLVKQERHKEQDGRCHRQRQDEVIAPRGITGVEPRGERKHDEKGDQKPTVVQPDLDPKDASELDL